MYMNNRAVESLTRGQLDDAYWWARAAVRQDPRFLRAYNTLAVIYQRHGNLARGRTVLCACARREPGEHAGHVEPGAGAAGARGAARMRRWPQRRLAQHRARSAPFHFFNLGRAAMRAGDYRRAQRTVRRGIDARAVYHEFHFWLALAHLGLGDFDPRTGA